MKDKVGWVPELGDLMKSVKGPGTEVAGELNDSSKLAGVAGERGKL